MNKENCDRFLGYLVGSTFRTNEWNKKWRYLAEMLMSSNTAIDDYKDLCRMYDEFERTMYCAGYPVSYKAYGTPSKIQEDAEENIHGIKNDYKKTDTQGS